jgi:hypothetical protein
LYQATIGETRVYGEAIAFYSVEIESLFKSFVIYRQLTKMDQPYPTVIRGEWPMSTSLKAMEVKQINAVVGIFESPLSKKVYVLRKHPALLLLQPSECGIPDALDSDHYGESDQD